MHPTRRKRQFSRHVLSSLFTTASTNCRSFKGRLRPRADGPLASTNPCLSSDQAFQYGEGFTVVALDTGQFLKLSFRKCSNPFRYRPLLSSVHALYQLQFIYFDLSFNPGLIYGFCCVVEDTPQQGSDVSFQYKLNLLSDCPIRVGLVN